MITVELNDEQFDAAWSEGIYRRHASMVNGFKTNNPRNKRAELMWDVGAALCEIAAAHYLQTEWVGRTNGVYDPDQCDVAPNIEVRYATGRGPLRIRDKDLTKRKPSTPYVLAWIDSVWTDRKVHLPGWICLADAVQVGERNHNFNNEVYEIGTGHLAPMRLLRGKTN